jgi:DNA-binding transcriptional LysR family regulator
MNISSRQLKAFLLIARLNNFTRAAEQLHITQAGLSIMMRELEAQMDCRLFDRTTRIVSLTDAGSQFLPVATHALAELEAAVEQINAVGEKARHTLRVAATPLVASHLIPIVCKSFRALYPEITVRVTDCNLGSVHALVESGEVDCGLGFFFKAARGIERTLLHTSQLMRVDPLEQVVDLHAPARGSKRSSDGKSVQWSSLRETCLISLPSDNPIQQLIETNLSKIGRANEDRQTFNHINTLLAMVSAGIGTAILPSFAMLACRHYKVRANLLSHPAASLGFHRITKRGRRRAHALNDFTNTLIRAIPDLMENAGQ